MASEQYVKTICYILNIWKVQNERKLLIDWIMKAIEEVSSNECWNKQEAI